MAATLGEAAPLTPQAAGQATGHATLVTPETVITQLAGDNNTDKIAVLRTVTHEAGADVLPLLPVLEAMEGGRFYRVVENKQTQVWITTESGAIKNALTQEELSTLPDDAENVTINNRVRLALNKAIAALRLASDDATTRLNAIHALKNEPDKELLPLLDNALAREKDARIKKEIDIARAGILLHSEDAATRLSAIDTLSASGTAAHLSLLRQYYEKDAQNQYREENKNIRDAAQKAVRAIESRVETGEWIKRFFEGASLGSILLLAALGLAITYGLMGVINMAHGELIMIGAYSAYVTQTLIQRYAPPLFDFWILPALFVSFIVAAGVGMILERLVIRYLYGRPLETLLATWGIGLILIQLARSIFGAQNVTVESPSWLSGGLEIIGGQILTYNRIALIVFAAVVLVAVALLLSKTRMGLFVRAVTQNRSMARALGVSTGRVDSLTFGLGAGLAGLAGCALTQIGNVGPELGQSYIVDSFMVVVLGGVGQIAGTVYAALGLGVINKFIEGMVGAVPAKIAILFLIVVFIQKRPQGIFALKGRFAD